MASKPSDVALGFRQDRNVIVFDLSLLSNTETSPPSGKAVAFVLADAAPLSYAPQHSRPKAPHATIISEEPMLTVQSASPEPALRPFIRTYVQREARLGTQELIEPVVARLGVMLEFEFAGSYEVRNYGSETIEEPNNISVIGPQGWRRSRLIIRGHIESLVVMFQPFGFNALFGVPTARLSNAGTEGHALLGHAVSHLHQQLGNLPTFQERAKALDTYFLRQLQVVPSVDPVRKALHLLTMPGSGIKVADVARQMGVNLRQLERRSLAYAGVSPKALARISRFSHALRLKAERSLTWTEIAHRANYHDHMHMIRDFRQFAGEAPTFAFEEIAPEHLIHFATSQPSNTRP